MKKYSLTLDAPQSIVEEVLSIPKLIICPESLRLNWYHEIKKIIPEADVQVIYSNDEPIFNNDWTIVGYQTVSKMLEPLKKHFNCVFVDECQYCKSVNNWGKPSSKRAAAVIDIALNAEYCYLLSGTPMPSHNKDLYNILKMLKCNKFNFANTWAFKNFGDKFCDPVHTKFGVEYSGNSNSEELHSILNELMVRRRKQDVLPDLIKQRQFIPISPKFKRSYLDIERRLLYPKKGDSYMSLAMSGRRLLSDYKLDTAIDLAETLLAAGESVVIVSNFIDTLDKFANKFDGDCVEIRGGMSNEDIQNSIEAFQSKVAHVCILSLMAGGIGITLTSASTMIIVDYAWLPTDMIQVEDRICRTGQTKPCMIYYIYCDNATLDRAFITTISSKSENIDKVVDNVNNTYDIDNERFENSTYLEQLKKQIEINRLLEESKSSAT